MKRECKNCMFWFKSFDGANAGECRINPPQIVLRLNGSKFPVTERTEWCGKFQPKTEQVNYEVSVGE